MMNRERMHEQKRLGIISVAIHRVKWCYSNLWSLWCGHHGILCEVN